MKIRDERVTVTGLKNVLSRDLTEGSRMAYSVARQSEKERMVNDKKQSPIERTIFTKERLIKRLQREIVDIKRAAADDIAAVQYRIKLAQTLVNALKRGK